MVVFALALLAVVLSACAKARNVDGDGVGAPPDDVDPAAGAQESAPAAADPVLGEDDAAPADGHTGGDQAPAVGTTVTVTGKVDEAGDENAFEMLEGDSGRQFLVLVADPPVVVDDVVRVRGTVRHPDFDALAAELDFEIDEDLYSPADQQQVIVAHSVEVLR